MIFRAVKADGPIPETAFGHKREKKSPCCRGNVTMLSHLEPSIYPRKCGRFSPYSLVTRLPWRKAQQYSTEIQLQNEGHHRVALSGTASLRFINDTKLWRRCARIPLENRRWRNIYPTLIASYEKDRRKRRKERKYSN